MIDWTEIATNSIWLAGLALLLATVSLAAMTNLSVATNNTRMALVSRALTGVTDKPWKPWALLGATFFCTGMALTGGWWLNTALWGLLALYLLYELYQALSRGGSVQRTQSAPQIVQTAHTPRVEQADTATAELPPAVHRTGLIATVAEWLVRIELLFLLLLAPLFIFPAPSRAVVFAALPILWIARWVARGRFVRRTPLDWPILVMLLMMLVSIFATPDLEFSLTKIAGLLFGIGLYYALVEWAQTTRRIQIAVGVYVLAGVALALLGLLGTSWTFKLPGLSAIVGLLPAAFRGVPGAESGFNPNEVGAALLWPVPLQITFAGWYWRSRSTAPYKAQKWRKLLAFALPVLALVSISTLLLTQSRNALASFGLGMTFLIWLNFRRARLALVALLVVGAALALAFGPGNLSDRLSGVDNPEFVPTSGTLSMDDRVQIWTRGIYGIEDFPLTGMGMNTFRRAMPQLYPLTSARFDKDMAHAHNQLLQAALDLGLPGLVSYLAIWMVAAALVYQTWCASDDALGAGYRVSGDGTDGKVLTPDTRHPIPNTRWWRATIAGIGAGLLSSFAFGMADAISLGAKPGFFFWGLLALLVTTWQLAHNEVARTASQVPSVVGRQSSE